MWAAIGVVVLLALGVGGAYWSAYSNRPVIEYSLGSTQRFYSAGEAPANPLPFNFVAKNTGPTDLIAAVTISAVNATVSTSSNGNYAASATEADVINRLTDWSDFAFYAIPNPGVTSFSLTVSAPTYASSYSQINSLATLVTYMIVTQTGWIPVAPQMLTYTLTSPNGYTLQS
jgi:hypothetical protein